MVKGIISKCVTCMRLRGRESEQFMVDLPSDILKEEPPFTYCGQTRKHIEALWTGLYLGQITSGKKVSAQNEKCPNWDIQKVFKIRK